MPIYEYECEECGAQAEVLQKFSDPPISECESCHGNMKKLISHNTFHLKGTGWYVTDYAGKSPSSNEPSRTPETRCEASNSGEKTKMETKSSAKSSTQNGSSKNND